MMKNILIGAILILLLAAASGCAKKSIPVKAPSAGEGRGKVEFSASEPIITLYDIVAKVGADIDYTSGIEIEKEEMYDSFEMWINASEVNIYEPGNYKATYTFFYNDKSISKEINVTIVKEDANIPEESADSPNGTDPAGSVNPTNSGNPAIPGNQGNQSNSGNQGNSGGQGSSGSQSNPNNQSNPAAPGNSAVPGNQGSTGNSGGQSSSGSQSNPGNQSNQGNQGNQGNPATQANPATPTAPGNPVNSIKPTDNADKIPAQTTTTRVFIPSPDREKNTTSKDLGYMNIELLSGSTVRVKCTTARYIVSTRTDVSEVTKKGVRYQVSKLIVKFNTGTEQILETNEKRIG